MSQDELRELLEAAKRVRAQYASTQEQARQLLKDEGVLAENGELAQPYRAAS